MDEQVLFGAASGEDSGSLTLGSGGLKCPFLRGCCSWGCFGNRLEYFAIHAVPVSLGCSQTS
jgi:hypothetical protein